MRRNLFLILLLSVMVAFIAGPSLARADSISPESFLAWGPTGFSATVAKTVTIDAIDQADGLTNPSFDGNSFPHYFNVSIDTSEVPLEVGVSVLPGAYVGDFDRSVERTFAFEVKFTDLEPGIHMFSTYATVDGSRVAIEKDSITSIGGQVPEPATMFLLGSGLLGLWGARKKFKK